MNGAYPEVEWLLNGEPREVQREALRRSYYGYMLRTHRDDHDARPVPLPSRRVGMPAVGWGHLMEMRLGKTPTIMNEFALAHKYLGINKLIVLSPNSYREDWAEEAEKYNLPVPMWAYEQTRLPHAVNFVNKAKRKWAMAVNYEATTYDQTLQFLVPLIDSETMIASDESIKIKAHEKLFFKAAMLLSKEAGLKRIATGLPMTQGPQDFYAQGRFIGMYSGYNYYAYRNKFCKMGGYKAKKVVGAKNEDILREQMEANAFIAKRKDWGDQARVQYFVAKSELTPQQKKLYHEIDADFYTMLDNGTEISADQVMSKMMKLQQISSGFVYDADGNAHRIMDPKKTPKVKRLLEFMSEELVGKIVVPFHYSESGNMLYEVMKEHGYCPAVIRGDAWMRANGVDVTSEKRRFQNEKSCRVALVQIAAGKYGHDLSGMPDDRASVMAFFETTYSLDDRGQIEARNTTAFQDWENLYIDLVSSNVEKKAIDALTRKENVVESILGAYREGKERHIMQ